MKEVWLFFEGKKVNIGAGLLFLSTLISHIAPMWNFNPVWLTPLCDSLDYIGGTFAGVGLGSKTMKLVKNKKGI